MMFISWLFVSNRGHVYGQWEQAKSIGIIESMEYIIIVYVKIAWNTLICHFTIWKNPVTLYFGVISHLYSQLCLWTETLLTLTIPGHHVCQTTWPCGHVHALRSWHTCTKGVNLTCSVLLVGHNSSLIIVLGQHVYMLWYWHNN